MIAHARRESPRECCGVLVGRDDTIVEAIPARNLSDDVNRFLLDPADHVAAMRAARVRGMSVVGFYHSHPHSAAVPSASDRDEASYPDHLYAIVGLAPAGGEVRVFTLREGNFEEVVLTF
jgi:proteasome lid subunit RPN8/RPN11